LHSAFEIGCNGVTLKTLKLDGDFPNGASRFDYAVEFTADVTEFDISDVDVRDVQGERAFDTALLTGASSWNNRRIKNARTPKGQLPYHYAWTSSGAAETIATFNLEDETAYTIRAKGTIKRTDTSKRMTYEIVGMFYRDGGGSATQQGATAVLVSIESNAGADFAFAVSGNNVLLQATADAAAGAYEVYFDFDIEAAT
jgi:hypothetical protein